MLASLFIRADDVLRGRFQSAERPRASFLFQLLVLVVLFGVFYGAVMGTFPGAAGVRARQMLYSATKVPLLLLVTFLVSLPSFFVLNTLLGVREDFGEVLKALLGAQAALTVVLASLAPLTGLWYVSFADYNAAILLNAVMFGVASFAAQHLLRRQYAPLIARNRRHRALLWIWIIIFAFVGIQMGWVLRPFIGFPTAPTQFFRSGAWGNAYVEVVRITVQLLRGH